MELICKTVLCQISKPRAKVYKCCFFNDVMFSPLALDEMLAESQEGNIVAH